MNCPKVSVNSLSKNRIKFEDGVEEMAQDMAAARRARLMAVVTWVVLLFKLV